MLSKTLTMLVKKLFQIIGIDIRRRNLSWRSEVGVVEKCITCERATLGGALALAAHNGLSPATVVDCGAAFGTPELYANFPNARHLLIEPLKEYEAALEKLAQNLKSANLVLAAASSRDGLLTINVHPDLVGSSAFLEEEDSDVNGVPRQVPAVKIDTVCQRLKTRGPYLLKLDVQGSELDVLSGAASILPETDLVVMETSFFEFYKGAPQIVDIIAFMAAQEFVPYDLVGGQYRLMDGAMSQVDVVFVKKNGLLRKHQFYATREQRQAQTQAINTVHER